MPGAVENAMKSLTSIVAVNQQGAIGCRNELPWRLRTDMQFFRKQTIDNVVIMGRKTYESVNGCLPHRTNIVLSHNAVLFPSTENCSVSCSIEECLVSASKHPKKQIFVMGGASTYAQFAPLVDRYLITVVDKAVADADAFLSEEIFGDIDGWTKTTIAEHAATDGTDEAPFKIFEWKAKDAEERANLRAQIISDFQQRALLTKKGGKRRVAISNPSLWAAPLELQL